MRSGVNSADCVRIKNTFYTGAFHRPRPICKFDGKAVYASFLRRQGCATVVIGLCAGMLEPIAWNVRIKSGKPAQRWAGLLVDGTEHCLLILLNLNL
jgi:hypothetical protein